MISNVEHLFICLLAICILLWKNVSSGLLLTFNWVFRSNQSILKEISPGCSLEGLMLKLKLQYFGHLMWRADSLKKTLMLGKIEGRRRRGQQRMRWLVGITDTMDMGLGGLHELVMNREAWRAEVHGVEKCRTWLRDWTELRKIWWQRCEPLWSCQLRCANSVSSCHLLGCLCLHHTFLKGRNQIQIYLQVLGKS